MINGQPKHGRGKNTSPGQRPAPGCASRPSRSAGRRLRRVSAVAAGLASALLFALPAGASYGCGPYPTYLFVTRIHPDLPLRSFAEGRLGVLLPTYQTRFLLLAYRVLSRGPLPPAAARNLARLAPELTSTAARWHGPATDWVAKWTEVSGARVRSPYYFPISLPGITKLVDIQRPGEFEYFQFLNCPEDAFHEAVRTLETLRAQLGARSSAVRSWTQAQNLVFANCAGVAKANTYPPKPLPPQIPSALPATAPRLAREARQYQIAAAHFYAGQFRRADAGFAAIARDPASPWRPLAPYLVARTWIRRAAFSRSTARHAALVQAERRLLAIAQHPGPYRDAARRLLGYVEFRLHPRRRLAVLAHRLMADRDPNFVQDAIDFHLLLLRMQNDAAMPRLRRQNDLINWVLTFRGIALYPRHSQWPDAWAEWRQRRSDAWLIAALAAMPPGAPQARTLLAAAETVPPTAPAYETIRFLVLRRFLRQGRIRRLRAGLASLLLRSDATPPSARNLFLALRFAAAARFSDLVAALPRVPALLADRADYGDPPECRGCALPSRPRLALDGLNFLNHFARLSLLARVGRDRRLPPRLRRQVLLSTWARAALLGRVRLARSVAPPLARLEPLLRSGLAAYSEARTPGARRFAATMLFLRFPGLNPYFLRRRRYWQTSAMPIQRLDRSPGDQVSAMNFWGFESGACGNRELSTEALIPPAWPLGGRLGSTLLSQVYGEEWPQPPPLVNRQDLRRATAQWDKLAALGPGADWLARQAIAWVRSHPRDPRDAEALARAAVATEKYMSCENPANPALSRRASAMLAHRYPKSAWIAWEQHAAGCAHCL